MLNKKDFEDMRNELNKLDNEREVVIKKSREIIKLSKQAIYSLHRNDLKQSEKLISELKKKKKYLHNKADLNEGSYSVALQEYVEALAFYSYIKTNKIPNRKQLNVNVNEYLMGICDLTGELVRKSVNLIIEKKNKDAKKIKELIVSIYGEFLKFDFRNGNLRRKSDSIKYNLKKIEEMMYDIR